MPSPIDRLLTRSIKLGKGGAPNGGRNLAQPSLGNQRTGGGGGGAGSVAAATQYITWASDGQPMSVDMTAQQMAQNAYLGQVYVMRGCRLIGDTISQLPWVAGTDPTDPTKYNKDAPLAKFLGPSTPQAPGGPNPVTNARVFWAWTIIQYLVTGRWAWECQLDQASAGAKKTIVGLWPLVSAALAPKPTTQKAGTLWFDGYEYTPSTGRIQMTNEQVIYNWRPSILDWRQPESILSSAEYPIYIANSINRYIANLLKNDLVGTTMIVTPPIEESDQRRAWQDQFLSEFTGVNNAGKTIFAEVEAEEGDSTSKPLIQVERLASSVMDSQLTNLSETAKNEICIALGTPKSLMGDASGRTFDNADAEWRGFWMTTLLDLITELQDQVNGSLAPRIGQEVGWFDLSKVDALQPKSFLLPPGITDLIQTGVANADQIATMLAIQPDSSNTDATSKPQDSDSATVERSSAEHIIDRWIAKDEWQRNQPINSYTLRGLAKVNVFPEEHITVRSVKAQPNAEAVRLTQAAQAVRQAMDVQLEYRDAELDALGDELAELV